jgi:ribosome biogenesis protein BMS1
MGVLTHLDSPKFKAKNGGTKRLRRTKKKLKQRFWTEIYQGAKLFYLSGLINGKYPKNEILNLSRFISVMKFRPLIWRNSHPYMLADRFEDLTPEALVQSSNRKCDRTISLYGYLRGTNMKSNSKVHIPGVGDLAVADITPLPDPCPSAASAEGEKRIKRLDDRQKLIHAPMSDVGGIIYDKDAVYISVPGNFTRSDGSYKEYTEGEHMVMTLQESTATLADKLNETSIQLLSGSKPLSADQVHRFGESAVYENGRLRRRVTFGDEDSDADDIDDASDEEDNVDAEDHGEGVRNALIDEETGEEIAFAESDDDLGENSDDEEPNSKWKENLAENAHRNFLLRKQPSVMDLVYGEDHSEAKEASDEDDKDTLFRPVKTSKAASTEIEDNARTSISEDVLKVWEDVAYLETIRNRFITGDPDAVNQNGDQEDDEGVDMEDEIYGDFEDLETGENGDTAISEDETDEMEKELSPEEALVKKKEDLKKKFNAQYDGDFDEDEDKGASFYEEVKKQMKEQTDLNRQEFENDDPILRAQVEGHRAGQYVRVRLENVPAEFAEHFDPQCPIVVGGLLANEDRYGYVQVRIKRHRWHRRVLKTNDPLIFSVGWRRFQSLPVYSMNDGARNRMLKYTPEHMHCLGTFYGPLMPPNTGFCCVQTVHEASVSNEYV